MDRLFLQTVAAFSGAFAALITIETYTARDFNPITAGATFSILNLTTPDLTIFIGDAPAGDPFFPVHCNPTNEFAGPCTITAGTGYSATYTNLNEAGLMLTYNGSTYHIS